MNKQIFQVFERCTAEAAILTLCQYQRSVNDFCAGIFTMSQQDNHRELESPPDANLLAMIKEKSKTLILHQIQQIMAMEWWKYKVNTPLFPNVASLLYSHANICPSFDNFLQSRDKELPLILKKRPVVKPRIFSGTERLALTSDPIVPKQLPLATRRNSAIELRKILNELYPNDNPLKFKQPRLCGPPYKQINNEKNTLITLENFPAKNNTISCHSSSLEILLEDESQKENADSTNIITEAPLNMSSLNGSNNECNKTILCNKNCDLNQIRFNSSTKKIIKVIKKRNTFSNSLADTEKLTLEDEGLTLKLIKKYRIKKCTIDIVRLKDSVIDYYAELRYKNYYYAMENSCMPSKEAFDLSIGSKNSGLKIISPLSETILENTAVAEYVNNLIEVNNVNSLHVNTLQNKYETQEPLAKRFRFEINLTKLKLQIEESESNNDHICKICKLTFDSVDSWNDHYENSIPKCASNLVWS